jgi:sulfur carrier protein ThiS
MQVRVRLYANLVRYYPGIKAGQPFEVELAPGSTLADLVTYLRLPPDQVKVMFINGIARDANTQIQPGDEIGIFSPIGGG